MKRYVSVFEMIARSSIYKVLLILGTMTIAQGVSFYMTMCSPSGLAIEDYIDQSHYGLIFKIAYVLITIILVLPGMDIGSKQSYTLQRLRIKERKIYWLQSLYNLLAYVLLWGMQLMVLLGSCMVYEKNLPEGVTLTNQTMFLAFHRNDFMHSILPLEDSLGWALLILIIFTTAFATAEFTKLRREGKFGFELLILIPAVLLFFPREMGYEYGGFVLAAGIVFAVMWFRFGINRFLGGD